VRAVVCHRISDDLSGVDFADVPAPAPGPGEALIRVRAASVNFPDVLMCQGRYQFKPEPPFVPGIDIAGEVEALGPNTEGPAVGAEIAAGVRLGGWADRCVAPVSALWTKPPGMSFAEAAAVPEAYLTAYVALVRRAALTAGETVLVLGAAGGVGLACVDLAKALGAKVIACASSEEKQAFLSAYGADLVLPAASFRDAVKSVTGGRGADVIVDPVGGDAFDEAVRAIAFGGRLLVVGFAGGRIATLPTNLALIKGFSLVGVRAGEFGRNDPVKGAENLAAVAALAHAGKVRPHVFAELPLEEAKAAMQLLSDRRVIGKAILVPDR
jgi:NADPH2:quinone reductase